MYVCIHSVPKRMRTTQIQMHTANIWLQSASGNIHEYCMFSFALGHCDDTSYNGQIIRFKQRYTERGEINNITNKAELVINSTLTCSYYIYFS